MKILLTIAVLVASVGQVQAGFIVNGGFETGDLSGGWIGNGGGTGPDWTVTSERPNTGIYSAYGNNTSVALKYVFSSLSVDDISSFSYSLFMDREGERTGGRGLRNIIILYTDGFQESHDLNLAMDQWHTVNMLPFLASGKSLDTLRWSGSFSAPLPSETWYDDFSLTTTSPVPEPSSLVLLATGAIGLIGYRRRKRKMVA